MTLASAEATVIDELSLSADDFATVTVFFSTGSVLAIFTDSARAAFSTLATLAGLSILGALAIFSGLLSRSLLATRFLAGRETYSS